MKLCNDCKLVKPEEAFSKCHSMKDGLQLRCKPCAAARNLKRRLTVKGALTRLASSARSNAKTRGRNGREGAAVADITTADLQIVYDNQKGNCYYSNVPMTTTPGLWQMSLERLDHERGYTAENVVLCCLACNTPRQWTLDIIKHLVLAYVKHDAHAPSFTILESIKEVKKWAPGRADRMVNGVPCTFCTHCETYKPSSEYLKSKSHGCFSCRSEERIEKRATRNGMIKELLGSARQRTKQRNMNKNRQPHEFNLSKDNLIGLLESQKGLCAISGMPLEYGPKKQFSASLDRKDVDVGYVPGNVQLVAVIFNCTDNSVMLKERNDAWGWNADKYKFFMEHAREKFNM